jgi:hypothetical protein
MLTAAFVFSNASEEASSPPQVNITDNEFMVGVMDCAWDNNYGNLPDLQFKHVA